MNTNVIIAALNTSIFFSAIAVTASCSRSYDLGDQPADASSVDIANPTWSNSISAVMENKCVTCHTPAAQRSKFVPGNTPETVDSINLESFFSDPAKASLVQRRVFNDTANPMPPKFATPLSDNEKIALGTWIGTKTVDVTALCGASGTSTWTFADASSVITGDCGSCHSGTGSLIAFDSVAKVQSYRSAMLQYLYKGSMPPTNATYKSQGNGALLFDWLCFGSDFK